MLTPLIGGFGWTEILVIAGVIFVLFGASRIPAAFRSLGEGINSFKEGLEGDKDGDKQAKALPEKSSGEENEGISVKQS